MAFPKKKRQRMTNEDDDKMDIVDDDVNGASVTATIKQQISCKDVLTKTLIDQLESELGNNKDTTTSISTSSSDDDAVSISLLRLKSFQRKILEKLRRSQKILAQQAEVRDKQELQLQNLRYQHELNEESQRRSSGEIGTTEIVRLVSRTATDNKKNSDESEGEDSTVLLQNYLGTNWNDPAQRPMIVAKLNLEVATRKNLEQQLRLVQQDRTTKLESLATKQKLLKDLPTKLADMEKASLSLQFFCQKSSSSSSSVKMDVTPKLGTKRRNRLDLAKTLPKALYTVYHQLQSSLDVMATAVTTTTDDVSAEISSETIPIVDILSSETDSTTDFVVLKIPIPTVSDGGVLNFRTKKSASVTFEYDERIGMVLARCGSDYDMGKCVIDELFPGDTGEWTGERNISSDERRSDEAGNKDSARAYQWCNYLGGLHIAPREQTAAKMHCSTKVIIKALVRRIRATSTLSWILHSLSRKPNPFPIHSAMKSLWFNDDDNNDKEPLSSIKLSSWIIVEGNQGSSTPPLLSSTKNNDNIRVYEAVLKCNSGPNSSSKTLTARVCINVARYPSIIPRWTILSSSSKSIQGEEDSLEVLKGEQMPLYNESLARLEKHVNRDVDQLVLSSDQTTYDWVLAQQLFEIGRGWEEMLLSNNA
ncbi:MAG: hypothetical protein ACI90V_011836 [Bacillariaceae sp.]|jgi:hypothetical protein